MTPSRRETRIRPGIASSESVPGCPVTFENAGIRSPALLAGLAEDVLVRNIVGVRVDSGLANAEHIGL